MNDIKNILTHKSVNILVDICKKYSLKGYSVLKKDGLINLISENLYNPQVQDMIRSLIKNNETTALILNNLLNNKNEISYEILRKNVLSNKSASVFRGYYKNLLENYILYEDDLSDDDLIYLPKEFNTIAKEIIERHIQDEIIDEIEEEDDFENITSLNQILYSKKYTSVESLRHLLDKMGLPTSGNKNQLIDKLFQQSEISLNEVMNRLFDKNELKDLCKDLGLTVSGIKDRLIESILTKFSLIEPPKEESKEKIKEKALTSTKVKVHPESIKLKATEKSLITMFNDLLSGMKFNILKVKDSESLISSISTLIHTEKVRSELKDINIIEGKKSSSAPSILIEKDQETIAISIWYFETPSKKKLDDLKARLFDFGKKYPQKLIFYIYDHSNKISSEELEKIEKDCLLIYKTADNFE